MIKPNLKLWFVAVMMFAAAGITLWQRQRAERWMGEAAALRQVVGQAELLREENQELHEQLRAAARRSEADGQELMCLYAQTAAFRKTEEENARLKSERKTSTPQARRKEEWMDRMYGEGTSDRGIHCLRWAYALIEYASEHDEQFPTSLREVVGFLGNDEAASQTALTQDQYEILYMGRRDDLSNPGGTPVLREKQPRQTAEGIWTRAYAYGNAVAKIQTSADGNFDDLKDPPISKTDGQ